MADKTFYTFEIITIEGAGPNEQRESYRFMHLTRGAVGDARDAIENLGDGQFLVLEDTSGTITRSTETITKTRLAFDPPRKKERKAKDATATPKPTAKKTATTAAKPPMSPSAEIKP